MNNYLESLSSQPNINNNFETDNMLPNKVMTAEDEMELYGIENNCIRVINDYMNGGYMCDDFD